MHLIGTDKCVVVACYITLSPTHAKIQEFHLIAFLNPAELE